MRSTLEGLRDSASHCSRVLSVAGFFALSPLFPLGGWVYSERRKTSFCAKSSFSLQQPGNNCREQCHRGVLYGSTHTRGGIYRGVHTLPTYPGRHIQGCTYPTIPTREAYTGVYKAPYPSREARRGSFSPYSLFGRLKEASQDLRREVKRLKDRLRTSGGREGGMRRRVVPPLP